MKKIYITTSQQANYYPLAWDTYDVCVTNKF